MSGDAFINLVLPENIIRDMSLSVVNAGNYAFDFGVGGIIGLDVLIINNGAAALTIAWNGGAAIPVAAGAAFAISSTKIWLVTVVSAVNYNLVLSGVRYQTLQAKGLVP